MTESRTDSGARFSLSLRALQPRPATYSKTRDHTKGEKPRGLPTRRDSRAKSKVKVSGIAVFVCALARWAWQGGLAYAMYLYT